MDATLLKKQTQQTLSQIERHFTQEKMKRFKKKA